MSRVKTISLLLLLMLVSAIVYGIVWDENEKFDSEIWKQKEVDWWLTDFRERMVKDLIKSDTLIGLDQSEIIELLGDPDSQGGDTAEIEYVVREKYSWDIDPDYISYLVIELDSNRIAIECELKIVK